MNPFEPISFTLVEIDNPFHPPEFGKGGFNSGVNLDKYEVDIENTAENDYERDRRANENAQRTYRNRNREAYNANMLKLWKANRDANNDSFKNWKANQAIANKNYRLNQLINNPSDRSIENQLRKLWSKRPKKVGRRKKGSLTLAQEKEQFYDDNWDDAKKQVIDKYKKDKEDFLKLHPDRDLKDGGVYPAGYEHKIYDPEGLAVGREVRGKKLPGGGREVITASANKQHNKGELSDYYTAVITNDRPIPERAKTWQVGSRKYDAEANAQQKQTNFDKKRVRHRSALSAGTWDINGTFKRSDGKTGKRTTGVNKFEI